MHTVGVCSIGKMGLTIGQSIQSMGNTVFFSSDNRSSESIQMAKAAGFTDVGSLYNIAKLCKFVICIGTGNIAFDIPDILFRECGFNGVYIDMNSLWDESSENKWRNYMNGITTNYCESAIRGYPTPLGSLSSASTHMILVSGSAANKAFSLFSGERFHVQYSASPAKTVNRLIAYKHGNQSI